MTRFVLFAAAFAGLAFARPAWTAPPASASPAAETPQAAVGKLTVYVDGKQVFSHDISDGKTKLFSELVFDVYLVLGSGGASLEVDGPLGISQSFPLVGGPKHYDESVRVHVANPLGQDLDTTVRVVLDLF